MASIYFILFIIIIIIWVNAELYAISTMLS